MHMRNLIIEMKIQADVSSQSEILLQHTANIWK